MPTIPDGKKLERYSIIDAAVIDDDGNTFVIEPLTYNYGTYTGYYPYLAAENALTGIYKWMKKTDYYLFDNENAPLVIFVLKRHSDGSLFGYRGERVIAPQSRNGPRVITGPDGRVREHMWRSKVYVVSLEDLGYANQWT